MSAAERRKELRRRQKALRATAAARRKALRRRLEATPAFQLRARRRRLRQLLTAVALLLLVLACCDRCAPESQSAAPEAKPPPSPPVEVSRRPDAGAKKPARAIVAAPKIEPARRGRYELDETRAPTWLELFRAQVSSRAPRLAACFEGAERPGALRWSAALTPESGLVGDQLFERLGPGDDVAPAQRDCLVRVLSSPPYRLGGRPGDGGSPPSTPTRVGLVLEF